MEVYFAPMEGLTKAGFRNIFADLFPGVDKYFTPFLGANQTKHFQRKEIKDIAPENNTGMPVVPQIMSNKPDEFVWALQEIASYGYREMNLNLGCPMPQVAKRGKGSGFLADPDLLERFFDESFELLEHTDCKDLKISVKTRSGVSSHQEAERLMDIYNQYPLHELIIHPRTRDERYNGHANQEIFSQMYEQAKCPVCYNGDIFTFEDYHKLQERFPGLNRVMIGRGFLMNPMMAMQILDPERFKTMSAEEKHALLRDYHDRIFLYYQEFLNNEKQAVMRMKGIWYYLETQFPEQEKLLKKVKKAKNMEMYLDAVELLFASM